MSLCIHRLPKAICESEGQATDLSISYRHRIVGEAVLIHYHIIERDLACDPSDDVAASVRTYRIIPIPEAAPQK
jgi:hypothetical protein